MSYSQFKEIIDKVGDYLIFIGLWNYGEPLVNPELYKMIGYCSKKNIITILSTNGILLNEENSRSLLAADLKYLIICLDGISDDIYKKYRNTAQFTQIKNNIIGFCELKKKNRSRFPIVELQFIVMRDNEYQVNNFFSTVCSWGVNRASLKKFSMLRNHRTVNEFMPKNEDYRLDCYKKAGHFRKIFCRVPWQSFVVNSDGWVVPCCSDYFSAEKMGNVFTDDVKEIWNNSNYIKFRRNIRQNINSVGICINCPHSCGQAGDFISVRQF